MEKKTCAICLTDLDLERVLKVPCDHIFHKECLVGWLKRSTYCPLCRTDIEQSLAPNSPQRLPSRAATISYPPPAPRLGEIIFSSRPNIDIVSMSSSRSNNRDITH